METILNRFDNAFDSFLNYSPKLVLAIILLIVGFWVIKMGGKSLDRALDQSKIEPSLHKFLKSLIGILLKLLLLITVAQTIGLATTSFVAIIGAAGLAIGLALQGSLANFAGGVLILTFKPFKIGDWIEAQGYLGKVDDIQIFNTILKTGDNRTVFIPNGPLSGGSVINYSTETHRRIDMTFGISYKDDIQKVKSVLKRLIDEDSRILKNPEPVVLVTELADSAVNIAVRVWCNSADYLAIHSGMQEKVKKTFDQEGFSIPFPQSDVHLFRAN